ncbi:hypothetical protein Chor_010794 [Crotalus horridus]
MESRPPLPLLPEQNLDREVKQNMAELSLWTVVAAIQAVERKVDSHASRLLNLERRVMTNEKKYVDCENAVVDFGNQMECKLTALGTLIQDPTSCVRDLGWLSVRSHPIVDLGS